MDLKEIKKDLVAKDQKDVRGNILEVQNFIESTPNSYSGDTDRCPLKHSFSDGMYVREIFIPAGELIAGKIHKHRHPNFLLKGTVEVFTEEKHLETLVAPCSMISSAGTKRILYAETDLVWVTVHNNPTNTRDLKVLEDSIIAESFEEYDKFEAQKVEQLNYIKKNSMIFRIKKYLIKTLEA
jgi:hypothetical protein